MDPSKNFNPPCPTHFFNEANSLLKWKFPRKISAKRKQPEAVVTEEGEETELPLEKLLNGVFPPRRWEENGITWYQKVSPDPARRLDVIKLSQRLDNLMAERDARDSGICDVRRRLHTELMDEVTRQIIIQDEPLGLLLLRVRDDLSMTIMCYKAMFENSVQYGLKKALEAEQGRRELEDMINKLQEEKATLEAEMANAMKSVYEKERKALGEKDLLEALHVEKMEHYEKTNHALQEMLDSIIITKM